jgi:hypothetical protein
MLVVGCEFAISVSFRQQYVDGRVALVSGQSLVEIGQIRVVLCEIVGELRQQR